MEKKWKYSSQTCRYIVHDKTFWFVSVTLYPWTSPRLLSGYCHRSVESAWKQKTWSILLLKKHSGLFFHFFWSFQLLPEPTAADLWYKSPEEASRWTVTSDCVTTMIHTQIRVLVSALCTHVNCGNFWMNVSMTSLIWSASSRVGVMTRAPTCRRHQLNLHRGSTPRSSPPSTKSTEESRPHLHLLQLLFPLQQQFYDGNDKSERLSAPSYLQWWDS